MTRRVRSVAGEHKYRLPIGSVIEAGGLPTFRVNKLVVHHSSKPEDKSRVVVASAGPVKRHITAHTDKDAANDHLQQILDNNPHLVHIFHNVRGRIYRLTGDDVHAQMGDGSFQHVGSLDYKPSGEVLAKPTPTWARKQSMAGRAKAHPSIREALDYLSNGVDEPDEPNTPIQDRTFRVTKQLREALNSAENANMRPIQEGETKTHDGQPIPPAWTQVEISKDPNHYLQARGRDDIGRVQPLYALSHTKGGLTAKFVRTREVAKAMPKLDKGMTPQAIHDDDTAAAVYFMRHTGARVDSSSDDKEKIAATAKGIPAFGTTSLQARHVKVKGDVTHVDYIGKNGMRNTYKLRDKNFAEAMTHRLEGKGPREKVFDTDATKTAAFIKKHLGIQTDRPNHDLRTHFATSAAAQLVANIDPEHYPTNEKDYKKLINHIGDTVGDQINDTRSVALTSYIDPEVLKPLRSRVQ